ncbi:putative peptidyl-tRNA hydrolase PTRHD1 [Galendromus occidentalis]|uniref:peptidyl-tRNA hydrolase n=1 Tax=Galendromus occidentalis TaxID=34638 RepID=A0AAJ6QWH7_9ACAR|nr:putative peptidyl-tRNA hydrolase PTRHD1 [Galendromus occidentalis]
MSKETVKSAERIVQYILVRSDLFTKLKWPKGAVMAQACHASNAVLHMFRDDTHVKEYLSDVDNMTTVILGGESESALLELQTRLQGVIDHKLWIEQPEGIVTALATKPYPKSIVAPYFTPFKTLK